MLTVGFQNFGLSRDLGDTGSEMYEQKTKVGQINFLCQSISNLKLNLQRVVEIYCASCEIQGEGAGVG